VLDEHVAICMFWGEGFKFVFDFNFYFIFHFFLKARYVWLLNFFSFFFLEISLSLVFRHFLIIFFNSLSSPQLPHTSLPIFHQKNGSLCLYLFLSRRRLTTTRTHDSIANSRGSSISSSVMEKRPVVCGSF
jgi:hypothetical protein